MLKKFLIGTVVALALLVGVTASAAYDFGPSTLKVGSRGQYVMNVQTVVGATPVDGVFGNMTKAKVMAWQASNGLTADGVVGPATKNKMNAGSYSGNTNTTCPAGQFDPMTGKACGSTTTGGSTGGALTGGAGTVDEYKLLSSPTNNREVGEDEEDVKVLGLSVEADGSDLSVTAMKLVFDESTGATSDFEDYATEVSVWYDSKEVARLDADEFNDDNNWSKTVSLSGAVVKDGEVGKFYVAVSGVGNLDSSDKGDKWTLDVTSVRYMDAQGALVSEDPTLSARTFSFETLATANDLELKLSESSSNPDAQMIDVDDSDATDNVVLLKTTLKAIGGDIDLKEMTVDVTPAGTGDASEIASSYVLKVDGEEFSVDSTDCTVIGDCDGTGTSTLVSYLFDDIDMVIEEGDTVNVEVLANVNGTSDYAEGDSLIATIDNDDTTAEDSSGEELAAADLTGSVTGEEQAFRSSGIQVKFVSSTATKTAGDPGATTPTSDEGGFSITFDVTAFDTDAYLDKTAPDETGTDTSDIDDNGAGTLVATLTAKNTLTGTNGYKIAEGTTERFTIDAHTLATTSGYFKLQINDLMYALTDINGNLTYNFNLDEFKTDQLYLTDR